MDRIKRLSMEILNEHKDEFGIDFKENKKTLDQISIIRSKCLKNELAGFITKFIKREIREKESKEEQVSKQIQTIKEDTPPGSTKETKLQTENTTLPKTENPQTEKPTTQ